MRKRKFHSKTGRKHGAVWNEIRRKAKRDAVTRHDFPDEQRYRTALRQMADRGVLKRIIKAEIGCKALPCVYALNQ